MSDPNDAAKSFLDLTIADLKTGADFKDDGVPAPGLSEKASATPASKEKIKFTNALGVGANDEVIDVLDEPDEKVAKGEFIKAIGGEANLPATQELLQEIVAFSGVDLDAELGRMTPAEQNAVLLSELKEYREVLATTEKAQAVLSALYGDPDKEPMKSYIRGKASPAVNEVFRKLWLAAHGEPITERPR